MDSLSAGFSLDEEVDRRRVPALKTHHMVIGSSAEHLFAAGVADMDFKAPPCVLEAMEKRLRHGVFGYEAVPDQLYPAVAGWAASRHGWALDTGHIVRAPNVLNSLAVAASLFTHKGCGVIVQPPVFFDFFSILRENHRQIVSSPLIFENGRYVMDFDRLEKLAASPRNQMMFLCNPHNPVGRVWTRDELLRLGDICLRNNVVLVCDEIHGDITYCGHPYTPFASLGPDYGANAIVCLSPAKSFNIASCCSAFTIIADDRKRAAFLAENSRLTVNKNNAFASAAMVAAYLHGAPWLDRVLAYLEDNVALVRQRLHNIPEVQLIEPEGTFLLWLDFRALAYSPPELTSFLRQKAGWAVTRGEAFGEPGEGFARVNIACTRATLTAALDRLETAVKTT